MGKPAVTGAAKLQVDTGAGIASAGDAEVRRGDVITIDGTSGGVYQGEIQLVPPEVPPELDELLEWADELRSLGVRANADTAEDGPRPTTRRRGHRAGPDRAHVSRRATLDRPEGDPLHRSFREGRRWPTWRSNRWVTSRKLLEAMDGLPVVIRLLDPPLHEFLPSRLELEHEMLRRVRAGRPIDDLQAMSDQVARWEEDNPMLGLRGVRLGLMLKDLYRMQARAATAALTRRIQDGGRPPPRDNDPTRRRSRGADPDAGDDRRGDHSSHRGFRVEVDIPIGTMIELPRAALTAGEIAGVADFFSFGTNDLTQMTYGLSRDDAEGLFRGTTSSEGILSSDPFQTLDQPGVGRLVRVATKRGGRPNEDLVVGLCGEHGGDPESIYFVHSLGLDYVSCSPPRVEGARLAAAQAALQDDRTDA